MTDATAGTVSPVQLSLPEDPGVRLAFSGRADGNVSLAVGGGEPLAARRRLLGLVGLEPGDGVFMQQRHGTRIAEVGGADRGRGLRDHRDAVADVDGLVTRDPGVALVVLVADCVPLLLAAPGRGVAAIHAGRRGLVAGVVGSGVVALAEVAGVPVGEIAGVVGPAIGGCCYEVPAELAVEVGATLPSARATTRWGTPGLDLPAATAALLVAAGVGRVERVGGCTRCDPERWFSHRATTALDAPAGRQAGVVRLGAASPAGNDAHPSLD